MRGSMNFPEFQAAQLEVAMRIVPIMLVVKVMLVMLIMLVILVVEVMPVTLVNAGIGSDGNAGIILVGEVMLV